MTSLAMIAPTVRSRSRAALTTVFAIAAALAVCVVMLFWTPLEAPASWRAAGQTQSQSSADR